MDFHEFMLLFQLLMTSCLQSIDTNLTFHLNNM